MLSYTVHGILQARILEWVACPFSSGSSQPRNRTRVSCIAGGFFTNWATREALFYRMNGTISELKSVLFQSSFYFHQTLCLFHWERERWRGAGREIGLPLERFARGRGASPVGLVVGTCLSVQETWDKGSVPGLGRAPGGEPGNPFQDFLSILFTWKIIALHSCVGFCHPSTWVSHRDTYVPALLNPLPVCYPTPRL